MYKKTNNFGDSKSLLEHNQFEALKTLAVLLAQEISFLERTRASLEKDIECEKPICFFTELRQFEVNMIRCALIRSMGNQTNAARLLGMKVTTLNSKIKHYKIDLTDVKSAQKTLTVLSAVTENTNGSAAVA